MSKADSDLIIEDDIEEGHGKPAQKQYSNRCVKCLCQNRFMLTIIAGVAIGFAIGFGLRALPEISVELKTWICKCLLCLVHLEVIYLTYLLLFIYTYFIF